MLSICWLNSTNVFCSTCGVRERQKGKEEISKQIFKESTKARILMKVGNFLSFVLKAPASIKWKTCLYRWLTKSFKIKTWAKLGISFCYWASNTYTKTFHYSYIFDRKFDFKNNNGVNLIAFSSRKDFHTVANICG